MNLDDDTLRKIEENRIKALEIRAQRQHSKVAQHCQSDPVVKVEEIQSANIVQSCSICGMSNIDELFLKVYNEKVCRQCSRSSPDFVQITKQDAVSKFLVTEYSLRSIPHQLKDNPHKKGWNEMKLYLRKHVLALALRKWGNEQNLDDELAKRSEKHSKRKLGEVESFLSSICGNDCAHTIGKESQNLSKRQKSRNFMKKLKAELKNKK